MSKINYYEIERGQYFEMKNGVYFSKKLNVEIVVICRYIGRYIWNNENNAPICTPKQGSF